MSKTKGADQTGCALLVFLVGALAVITIFAYITATKAGSP